MFVAKYEYGPHKQASLKAHQDGTLFSFILTLNEPDVDFLGGGTRFIHHHQTISTVDSSNEDGQNRGSGSGSGVVYRPSEVGTAIAFCGKQLHEGVPVTSGVRYILTGFCEYNNCDRAGSHESFLEEYDPRWDGTTLTNISPFVSYSVYLCKFIDLSATEALPYTHTFINTLSIVTLRFLSVLVGLAAASGIRTGDILRGIYITTEGGYDLLIPTKDLPIEQVYNAVAKSVSMGATGPILRIVVERSLEEDWTPNSNEEEDGDGDDEATKPLPYPHLPLSLHPLGSKRNRPTQSVYGNDHCAERILAAYIKANALRLCSTGSCWALDDLLKPIS